MIVNLRLILYVLPTPLISKIPLELIKTSQTVYLFRFRPEQHGLCCGTKKSKEEEIGRVQCNWDKKRS